MGDSKYTVTYIPVLYANYIIKHNISYGKGTEYNIPMLLNKPGTGKIIKGEVWEVDYQKLAHLGTIR